MRAFTLTAASAIILAATAAQAQLATPILGADQANVIQGSGAAAHGLLTDGEFRPLPPSEDAAALPDPAKFDQDVSKDEPDISKNIPQGEDPEKAKAAAKKAGGGVLHGQASSSHATGKLQAGGQNAEPAIPLPKPELNPEMEILLQLQSGY